MGVNSLPKTVTRQRRDCDLNPCPTAPESSTLTYRATDTIDPNVGNSRVATSRLSMGWVDPWLGLGWVHYSKSSKNLKTQQVN